MTTGPTGRMRPMLYMIAGGFLVLVGAHSIYSGYEAGDPSTSAIGWAGVIGGALALLFGISRRVGSVIETAQTETTSHGASETRALIQAMGVVAVADKRIRDIEIATIAGIHERMLGLKISEDEVRDILSEFGSGFNIRERLEKDRGSISPQMKRVIVQSCHLVMISDLEIVSSEEDRVSEIGKALGYTQSEIKDLVATAGV